MDNNYDLELAKRRMAEFQNQVKHDNQVKKLKEGTIPLWRRSFNFILIRLGKYPKTAPKYIPLTQISRGTDPNPQCCEG
jgi:hypothetical protein